MVLCVNTMNCTELASAGIINGLVDVIGLPDVSVNETPLTSLESDTATGAPTSPVRDNVPVEVEPTAIDDGLNVNCWKNAGGMIVSGCVME